MKSVYKSCSEALRELAKGSEPFTELDVISRASEDEWSEENYKKAMTQANQIAYAFYRSGQLARFGPIHFENEEADYVRRATKILYAGVKTGPERIDTPNGSFDRLMVYDDDIASVGRRSGTNRDDFAPRPVEISSTEYDSLQEQIKELKNRVHELENPETIAST